MPSLNTASRWLDSKLSDSDGADIIYRRGGAATTITGVVVGQTQFVQETDEAVIAQWRGRDYFIAVDDLLLGGVAVKPEDGDRITQTVNGVEKEYEVVSASPEPCYRYTGPDEAMYRIHTKQVA